MDKKPLGPGALLVAPSLESTCVMYLRHKNQDSPFSEDKISYFNKIKGLCHHLKSYFWLGFWTRKEKRDSRGFIWRII